MNDNEIGSFNAFRIQLATQRKIRVPNRAPRNSLLLLPCFFLSSLPPWIMFSLYTIIPSPENPSIWQDRL